MGPGTTAVASAGLGALAPFVGPAVSLLGGVLGRSGQRDANRRNLQIAREQMAFQERMSSTAYQRAAADAEKAGLNRILALGSPASTPSGAAAVMGNEEGAGVTSAQQAALTQESIRTGRAQRKLMEAQEYEADERANREFHQARREELQGIAIKESTANAVLEGERRRIENQMLRYQSVGAEMQAKLQEMARSVYNSEVFEKAYKAWLAQQPITGIVDDAVGAISPLTNKGGRN